MNLKENLFKNKIMNYKSLFIVFSILFSSLSLGCIYNNSTDLEGTSWKLEEYLCSEGNLTKAIPNVTATLIFDEERATGTSGCNSFFGNYSIGDKSLSFGPIGSTLMYCMYDNLMDQEYTYFMRLGEVQSYEIEEGMLKLRDSKGEILVVLSKN